MEGKDGLFVNIDHTSQTGCTGQRNRAAFVPIQSFGDTQLRNGLSRSEKLPPSQ
jgi:hypothetical protein